MRWRILTIGKPALAFARDGAALYANRIARHLPLEVRHLKDAGSVEANGERLRTASDGCLRIVLDERGVHPDTMALVGQVERWSQGPRETIAFLVGGADGHSEATRSAADTILALSPLTLQHEVALVVLLEQLYRICTIRRGEPYHR